ncbi:hypothetical protein G6F46_015239 [Rhizopus delemar]|nr:hypothetical protein G6F46_015239 [Rhizopus delemar]
MAVAMMTLAYTMTGGKALGRISRKIRRRSPMPSARPAWTNSRALSVRNSDRGRRATGGHDTRPIASTTVCRSEPNTATSTSSNRKLGRIWKASVTRINRSSMAPPE